MQSKCEHYKQKTAVPVGIKTTGAEIRPMLLFWFCDKTGRIIGCEGDTDKCEVPE